MSERELPLDNPLLVSWEFASEERLDQRNALYRQLVSGVNAEDVVFEAVREVAPQDVLDVGCGAGELAERIAVELGARVVGVDSSPRMVELTRSRGVDVRLGTAQALQFEDASFDCVVAGWLFYHVVKRAAAIAECARVLRPGGRLVAATLGDDNLADLWPLLRAPPERPLSFSDSNGAEQLEPFFARIEKREANGVVVFPSPDAMRRYVAAHMTRAHYAVAVPDFEEPVSVRTSHTVFVADKAA